MTDAANAYGRGFDEGRASARSSPDQRVRIPVPTVPNVAQRVNSDDTRYQILALVGGAALIRFAAGMGMVSSEKAKTKRNLARSGLSQVPVLSFIAIYIVLAIASDFDATRDLATSFALLLFVMVLIQYGNTASINLLNLVGHQPSFKKQTITGPDRKV